MVNDFSCPICKGQLMIQESLVISVKSKTNQKGLIFLNPEVGNYGKVSHPSFKLVEGEVYTVYCPICHATLNTEANPNILKMHMIDKEGVKYDIYFSVVVGEKCTYVVKDKTVQKAGPDIKLYEKYFDVPEEDKKYL